MLLIDPERLKEFENQANTAGYTFDQMMNTAGKGLAEIIDSTWHDLEDKKILGLIGGGKNGADTLIALTRLHALGWKVTALKISPSDLPGWVVHAFEETGCTLEIQPQYHRLSEAIAASPLILDGIIGTGFVLPLRSELADSMKFIKQHIAGKTVIAVDCPSGVDCSSGTVEPCTLAAQMTVCMEGVKTGLMKFPAFEYAGEIKVVDVGIRKKLHKVNEASDKVIDSEMVSEILPVRKSESHKGTFGSVLVCGGSVNYPGAPVFAARAAYRAGTGLVRTAVPERIFDIVAGQCLESTWLVLNEENGVISEPACKVFLAGLDKASCVVIGPGMGTEETTGRFIKGVLITKEAGAVKNSAGFIQPAVTLTTTKVQHSCPVVIDADGLRLLAKIPDWSKSILHPMVLTPHPGEMSGLTGLSVEEIQKDRVEICRHYALEWKQVVVLKGALTVVASPEGQVAICPVASSALAKAGSGDLLSGLIAGLVSQGVDLFAAAMAGVWLHGMAGIIAAERCGNEYSVGIAEILEAISDSINMAVKK